MKNDVEVRQDVFAVVVQSEIKDAIGGEVRYIPRKAGSKAEDCIISVLDSDNAQIQDCIVNVNITFPAERHSHRSLATKNNPDPVLSELESQP